MTNEEKINEVVDAIRARLESARVWSANCKPHIVDVTDSKSYPRKRFETTDNMIITVKINHPQAA